MDRKIATEAFDAGTHVQVCLHVAGWRIDLHHGENGHVMLHIANTAKDGEDAGWCACAYDSAAAKLPPHLHLTGSERE